MIEVALHRGVRPLVIAQQLERIAVALEYHFQGHATYLQRSVRPGLTPDSISLAPSPDSLGIALGMVRGLFDAPYLIRSH